MRKLTISFSLRVVALAAALTGTASLYGQDDFGSERSRGSTLLGETRSERTAPPSNGIAAREDGLSPAREVYLSEINRYLTASREPLAVHLIAAPAGNSTLREARFGAAISQILALRAEDRTVIVTRGTYPIEGRFNVIFGTADVLSAYLTPDDQERIKNGYIALRRFGSHSNGYLLIATGRTPDKVAESIMSLGVLKEQLPKAPYASIRQVVLPEAAPFMKKAPLTPGEVYTFDQLKEAGALRTTRDSKLSLDLFIPGYISTDSDVPVSLTLRFQSQRRALSSSRPPQIHVNGSPIDSAQMARRDGDAVEVQFPMNWLKAGRNLIETERLTAGRSDYSGIAGDSKIELPDIDKHPALPDLQLATGVFYPFIGEPSGKDICVVLGSLESETLESAWTFLARLAQSSNTFFYESEFTVGELDPTRHNVIVGSQDKLPEPVRNLVNFEALKQFRVVKHDAASPYTTGINLQSLIQKAVKGDEAVQPTTEAPKDDDLPTRWGFLASAPSVASETLWYLLLTAPTSDDLRSRTRDLVRPEFWEKVETDICTWGSDPASMRVRVPVAHSDLNVEARDVKFPTGDRLPVQVWYGCVAALMLFSTVVTCWLLGKCDTMVVARQRRPR